MKWNAHRWIATANTIQNLRTLIELELLMVNLLKHLRPPSTTESRFIANTQREWEWERKRACEFVCVVLPVYLQHALPQKVILRYLYSAYQRMAKRQHWNLESHSFQSTSYFNFTCKTFRWGNNKQYCLEILEQLPNAKIVLFLSLKLFGALHMWGCQHSAAYYTSNNQ